MNVAARIIRFCREDDTRDNFLKLTTRAGRKNSERRAECLRSPGAKGMAARPATNFARPPTRIAAHDMIEHDLRAAHHAARAFKRSAAIARDYFQPISRRSIRHAFRAPQYFAEEEDFKMRVESRDA